MDNAEIDWMENRLNQSEMAHKAAVRQCEELKKINSAILVRNERLYIESRTSTDHERFISMLNQNHPESRFR